MTITAADLIFDRMWEKTVPAFFRGNAKLKNEARLAWNRSLEELSGSAANTEMVGSITAFVKISRMLRESKRILDTDDPQPDRVVDAVRALLDQFKLSQPTEPAP